MSSIHICLTKIVKNVTDRVFNFYGNMYEILDTNEYIRIIYTYKNKKRLLIFYLQFFFKAHSYKRNHSANFSTYQPLEVISVVRGIEF